MGEKVAFISVAVCGIFKVKGCYSCVDFVVCLLMVSFNVPVLPCELSDADGDLTRFEASWF